MVMRVRRLVGPLLGAALATTCVVVACRDRRVPNVPPPAPTSQPVATVTDVEPESVPTVAATATAAVDAGVDPAAARKAAECASPRSVIANEPAGGVVFNNAMTSADAGFIDRTQGVLDAIRGRSHALRCCLDRAFDGDADGGSAELRALLVITLSPDGASAEARIDEARSDLKDQVARACLVVAAQETPYPASPTNKTTIVEYPLVARLGADAAP